MPKIVRFHETGGPEVLSRLSPLVGTQSGHSILNEKTATSERSLAWWVSCKDLVGLPNATTSGLVTVSIRPTATTRCCL